jgi:hypothetical protein
MSDMTKRPCRLPGPWRVQLTISGYVVVDDDGHLIVHLHGRETEADAHRDRTLTKAEAGRIAFNIAQLPDLLGR